MITEPRPRWSRCARWGLAALAGIVLALGAWPLAPPAAHADSPVVQTWWTVNNLTVDLPVPPDVLAPGAVPPITIPSTDVPDGGSEVAGTTDSPTGALTLRYEFTEGAELGPLVLTIAGDVPVAPGTELIACGLAGDGRFESHPGGGPISKLPEYDCTDAIPGILDTEATTFTFEGVGGLATDEHLSVAILPVAGRVVLERALGDSLVVVEPERAATVPPLRPPSPTAGPPVSGPKPFLGQMRSEPLTSVTTTPPSASTPAVAREVGQRFVTVFQGTPAGGTAGSATAGAVLIALGAVEVWRRARAALDHADPREAASLHP